MIRSLTYAENTNFNIKNKNKTLPGVAVHVCDSSTWRPKQKDWKIKDSQGYMATHGVPKTKKLPYPQDKASSKTNKQEPGQKPYLKKYKDMVTKHM